MFMNDDDIDDALSRHGRHPVLGPAVQTLANLRDWTDEHSDGWPYWPTPARAATRLMELIEGDGTSAYRDGIAEIVTPEMVRRALTPVKAFRTRHQADFRIITP